MGEAKDFSRDELRLRRVLSEMGLLDRPWLILGGAPDPLLPAGILDTHARIDINGSGKTAKALGHGAADLTFRRAKANWAFHPDLETRGLVWFTRTPSLLLRLRLLTKHRQARVERIVRVSKPFRRHVVDAVLGPGIETVGSEGKPTNGIVAACFGLRFGVPAVVLSGVSLARQGHSYDSLNRPRRQVAEDAFALARLAAEPRLATTEAELAAATGIQLWLASAPADASTVVAREARG